MKKQVKNGDSDSQKLTGSYSGRLIFPFLVVCTYSGTSFKRKLIREKERKTPRFKGKRIFTNVWVEVCDETVCKNWDAIIYTVLWEGRKNTYLLKRNETSRSKHNAEMETWHDNINLFSFTSLRLLTVLTRVNLFIIYSTIHKFIVRILTLHQNTRVFRKDI